MQPTGGNEGVWIIRCFRSAPIRQTIAAAAELTAFGSVHISRPDTGSVDFRRVAVDDAGLPRQIVSCGIACRDPRDEGDDYRPSARRSMLCNAVG